MGRWLKENLVLVSGILLPALLVVGFFILNKMPRMLADPPAYDFLVVAYQYNYQNPSDYYLSFEVRDGKLSGRVSPKAEVNRYINRHYATIFLYRTKDHAIEEFAFDLPEGLDDLDESVSLNLGKAGELNLDKRKQSPDGYQFEYLGYRGRGGLLGDIFGMGSRYENSYVLKKGNTSIDLVDLSIDLNHYQNDLQFMGWVVNEDLKP